MSIWHVSSDGFEGIHNWFESPTVLMLLSMTEILFQVQPS